MKKYLSLITIMVLALLIPSVAKADVGFVFSNNECIVQSDATSTVKTCFLRVQSDEYINEIKGLLVYPNSPFTSV